jgi:hypothetical protein
LRQGLRFHLNFSACEGVKLPRQYFLLFLLLTISPCITAGAQTSKPDWKKVPVIDGGAGNCSVDFTVTDTASRPVYDAKINVHIAYGFMGVRKLDLQLGTNADGKARFQGLPEKVRQPLTFVATQDDLQGSATYDPSMECTAKHDIVLKKKKPDSN